MGINAVAGVKTQSRIDPTGIVTRAADILVAKNPTEGWTHDPAQAKQEKGQPVKHGDGKVSEVNHSNVPPTLEHLAGGVTIDHALHTVVLSLSGLRKLSFGEGTAEARCVLAALGLVALLAAEDRGHDLRSRCFLVPRPGAALALELVCRDGNVKALNLDLSQAIKLYEAAVAALPKQLKFGSPKGEPLAILTPSPKLAHLVVESRKLAAGGADVEEA